MIKVDKGLELPARNKGSGLTRHVKRAILDLDVGDSFLIPSSYSRHAAYGMARNLGIRLALRSVGENIYRAWRVE